MVSSMAKAANNFRYERKFLISGRSQHEIELQVRLLPALFSEIYHQRFVNNIYFDSYEMKSYFDNIDGAVDRTKFRIRWYGDLFGTIEKPILELKIKKALLGTKESYPLSPFSLDQSFNSKTLANVFSNSDIPEIIKLRAMSLKPTLLNRYSRKYYRSADGNYRITIDSGMDFYAMGMCNNFYLHKHADLNNIVLELKYDHDKDHFAHTIANFFPFRMTKNSKYLNGIEKLAH